MKNEKKWKLQNYVYIVQGTINTEEKRINNKEIKNQELGVRKQKCYHFYILNDCNTKQSQYKIFDFPLEKEPSNNYFRGKQKRIIQYKYSKTPLIKKIINTLNWPLTPATVNHN